MKALPAKLNMAYEKHYKNHSQPGAEELQDIFLAAVRHFDRIYLVLDALNECTPDQNAFLAGMINNCAVTKLKLFVTSRNELIDSAFQQNLIPPTHIKVDAGKVDSDIKLYVDAQIEQRLLDCSSKLREEISAALRTKASGKYVTLFHYGFLFILF